MSAVAICTDSSALFPAGVAERLGVTVVPIAITLDGAPFEGRDDAIEDFYTRLTAGAQVTTSQPSPAALLASYADAAASGASEVLSIHLDGRASGTVGAAELAARDAPIPVTVVDTRTVSFGVGVCVRAAAEAIAAGASTDDAVARVARVGATLKNVFVAYAGPRGRLPEASGWSLLEFAHGKVEQSAVCDALSEAIEAMAARLFQEERPLRVGVGHAAASIQPAADALARSLASMSHVLEVERYRVGAAVGAHTGGLSFGGFWWPMPVWRA
jgi:fatty acid-binding protein DegV